MKKLQIYISYSHLDKELAQKFFDYLVNLGYDVIWDENIILTGDNVSQKLMSALNESDVYLPIISENFERSNYTNKELLVAVGYNSSREYPRIFPYIVYGNLIPSDISTYLCFMGTNSIDNDLVKIGNQLEKIRGSIRAEQDTNTEIAKNLNVSLESYLKDVFAKLEKNEKTNRCLAYFSYVVSILFLVSIVILGIIRLYNYTYNEL